MTSELLRFRQLVIRYRCREERSGLLRIRCGGITPTAESAKPCLRMGMFGLNFFELASTFQESYCDTMSGVQKGLRSLIFTSGTFKVSFEMIVFID